MKGEAQQKNAAEERQALTLRSFCLKKGNFVLGPLDLSVWEGEIFALLGRTGSGKTLLLESIAGFYDGAYTGEIDISGRNAEALPSSERGIGFVYQDSGLFPHMTTEENIAYGLKMHRVPEAERREKVREMMALFGIGKTAGQFPASLSGGERQRAALARALVLSPDILLMDEPFSALDPATRAAMYGEIERIHEQFHCTVFFVTHDFEEARRLAQRAGILIGGRLCQVSETGRLFEEAREQAVLDFLGISGQERKEG